MRIGWGNFRDSGEATARGSTLYEALETDTRLSTERGGPMQSGKLYTRPSVESLINQSRDKEGSSLGNLYGALETAITTKAGTQKTLDRVQSTRKRDLINPFKIGANLKTAKLATNLPKTIATNIDTIESRLGNVTLGQSSSAQPALQHGDRMSGSYHGNPVYYDADRNDFYSPTQRHGDVTVYRDGRGGWTSR